MPKVSVIIPCYNSSAWIVETVDSVLAQTYKDMEVIVVNDGSSDNTEKLLQGYGDSITYLCQQNQGVPAARNAGLRIATGDFIGFLDGDDKWHPDKLKRQIALFDENPEIGVVFTDYSPFGDEADYQKGFDRGILAGVASGPIHPEGRLIVGDSLLTYLLKDLFPWINTIVVRRQCLEDSATFFDEELLYGADFQMTLRFALTKYKFAYIDSCLAFRRERMGSLSKLDGDLGDQIRGLENIAKFMRVSDLDKVSIDKALGEFRFTAGYVAFSNGNLLEARSFFGESLKTNLTFAGLFYFLASLIPADTVNFVRQLKHRSS
jgi:glycosyltransferase involved in cell wall biosynthesis